MSKFRKVYDGSCVSSNKLTPFKQIRRVASPANEIPVEKQMSPEALRHLHACIHYTHTVMHDEAERRIGADMPKLSDFE